MKTFIFIAFITFALCGCGDHSTNTEVIDDPLNKEEIPDGELDKSSHYITGYLVPDEIEVKYTNYELYFYVMFSGNKYTTYGGKNTEDYKKAQYFINLYGDTSYNGSIYPGMSTSIAYPIDKISIKCDKDFDAEHPAGEPLDDIVMLDYKSYYRYIESGYVSAGGPHSEDVLDHYVLTLDKIASDVTKLISAGSAKLQFSSAPTDPGKYTFTLETTINGKIFKSTFTHTFE